MDREGIRQRVLDTLGVIVVDKTRVHDQVTFAELALDEEDVRLLLQRLEEACDCHFPDVIRKRARQWPGHVSVPMLVDLIMLLRQDSGLTRRKAGRR